MPRSRNNNANPKHAHKMAPRPQRHQQASSGAGASKTAHFQMDENLRIAIQMKIDAFIDDPAEMRLDFPTSLTSEQRGYVHMYVRLKGLKSRSQGKGADRYLALFKRAANTVIEKEAHIRLSTASRQLCQSLADGPHRLLPHEELTLAQFGRKAPARSGRQQQHQPDAASSAVPTFRCSLGNQYKFAVPPVAAPSSRIVASRADLPIRAYRDHIVATVAANAVVVISGDTGSGKTTQVPQYLLEAASARRQPCRIICTQPRRLAAISIADRVAHERGEQLGGTVGYQIRLESRISQTSNLIYTTSGFLLRCLISGTRRELFSSLTHIILDEVHERDKFTDFLLITIKDAIAQYPQVKIILMSATIDSDVFTRYFGGCPLIDIPGRMFPVRVYNLEQCLGLIGYHNAKVDYYRKQAEAAGALQAPRPERRPLPVAAEAVGGASKLDSDTQSYVDEVLEECFLSQSAGADEAQQRNSFAQFMYLVTGEAVPVDTLHTETQMSALMSAASKGELEICRQLVGLGADPLLSGPFGLTAVHWAQMNRHEECARCLAMWSRGEGVDDGAGGEVSPPAVDESAQAAAALQQEQANNAVLLKAYQFCTNNAGKIGGDELDYQLMLSLILHIHQHLGDGAILIFLPGYDGIVELNEVLAQQQNTELAVFMLHGSMQAADQKRVFAPAPPGCRKIILSTNIAETSLTIDDVVFVIDSGLVKQKSFDPLTGATALTATCISQACAKQRMGRAGRVRAGFCFRLYSQLRFDSMEKFTLPEILRVPLTEIALSARIMCEGGGGGQSTGGSAAEPTVPPSITGFLSKAIQAPPAASVAQSIVQLKRIGALDEAEHCTQLGRLLVDIPVDVQLGKALLYAVVLRCLDPVLTIVSSLSVKDPFVLPMGGGGGGENSAEAQAKALRKQLADGSGSDHMCLLRVYQQWNEAKSAGHERQFCRENFVSSGALQMICGVRAQIVGHLRSLGMIQHRAPGNMNDLNRHADSWPMVKACLTAGLYPRVCRIDRTRGQLKSREVNKLMMHMSSVLRQKNPKRMAEDLRAMPTEWMLFEEMSWAGTACLVRWNTVVSPVAVALFAGQVAATEAEQLVQLGRRGNGAAAAGDGGSESEGDDNDDDDDDDEEDDDDGDELFSSQAGQRLRFCVDDWIGFVMDAQEARLLRHLRQRFNVVLQKVVGQPQKFCVSAADQQVIDVMAKVLEQEDRFCGLERQSDVGRRPIAVKLHMGGDGGSIYERNGGNDRKHQHQHQNDGKYFQLTRQVTGKREAESNGSHSSNGRHDSRGGGGGGGPTTLVRSNFTKQQQAPVTAGNAAKSVHIGSGRLNFNHQLQSTATDAATTTSASTTTSSAPAGHRQPAVGLVRGHLSVQQMKEVASMAPHRNCKVNADTARFYVVHANSELQVLQHFREPERWCWSHDMLKELLLTNYRHPSQDVCLFFYIPAQGRFCGAAKFTSTPQTHRTETLSVRSVSAERLRSIWYKPADARPTTTFDACQNGEEITDRKAARMLLERFS